MPYDLGSLLLLYPCDRHQDMRDDSKLASEQLVSHYERSLVDLFRPLTLGFFRRQQKVL